MGIGRRGCANRHIDLKTLKRALKHGGRVDASGRVLGTSDQIRTSNAVSGVHRPPFLVSAEEFEPFLDEPDADRSVRAFERLSLAARAALTIVRNRAKIANPPALAGRKARTARASALADEIRTLQDDARDIDVNLDGFPIVYAEDILKALAWVADELGPDQGKTGSAKTFQQLAMRGGLQLIGCHIRSRASEDGLRLVNARQPVSLRLIGCVVECPILLAHCELVSLDLSGSALRSLDATGLKASGSLHLRRTLVRTPVSFAGVRVEGSFNAGDLVIAPFERSIRQTPLEPDHGALNLSQARIRGELRLARARIWGGLSLRGAEIGRSLFLNRALIVSPLAMLEKHLDELSSRNRTSPPLDGDDHLGERLANADADGAQSLHQPEAFPPASGEGSVAWVDSLRRLEILRGATYRWQTLIQRSLSKMSARAVLTAVRADGLRVEGTLFARSMMANGTFRMKYAQINGAMRLEGSLFRCPDSIAGGLRARLQETIVRHPLIPVREQARAFGAQVHRLFETRLRLQEWDQERPDSALDLRDSQFKGDLSLGWQGPGGQIRSRPRDRRMPVDLFGKLRLRGLRTPGSIVLFGVHARATAAGHPDAPASPVARAGPDIQSRTPLAAAYEALFRPGEGRAPHGVRRRFYQFVAWIASWPAAARREPEDWTEMAERRRRFKAAEKTTVISMAQVAVGRDVDLRASRGVHGVDLENAEIGGDLRFADKSSGRIADHDNAAGFIVCRNRARDLAGVVNLRAASIGGDAFLVFDARVGPTLKAGMMTVGGRLDIYPQEDGRNYQLTDTARPAKAPPLEEEGARPKPGFWLEFCDHEARSEPGGSGRPPGRYCSRCNVMIEKVEDHLAWFIDLRQARATVFAHPPAAWPDPGALSIDGFAYQQTSDLGPLAPKPPLLERADDHHERSRLRHAWRRFRALRYLVAALACTLGFGLTIGATWALWKLGRPEALTLAGAPVTIVGLAVLVIAFRRGSRSAFPWWFAAVAAIVSLVLFEWILVSQDWVTAPVLSLIVALLIVWFTTGRLLLTLRPGEPAFRWSPGRGAETDPKAIEYLSRQRVSESRFKWRPSGYHVLDSYARVAKALREAGRYISANRVEEERIRKRTQMMSWRHHSAAKLVLTAVDVFAGYGFRISRAVTVICIIVCGVAVLAHWTAAHSYLVPVTSPQDAIAAYDAHDPAAVTATALEDVERRRVLGPAVHDPDRPKPVPLTAMLRPGRCGSSSTAASLNQDCPDLIYAADLLLPFIDLGEEGRWKPQIPEAHWAGINTLPEPLQSLWVSILRSWPAMINALGLLLSAIMITAVAARVESAFARVEE